MMTQERLTTAEKALRMNMDQAVHGTFAEIGAGQECARWFFRVGGASATVAKTMSAYDMAVSDAIYGTSDRYVSRGRLESMLDHEFKLLLERLNAKLGATTRFFAFADTVAARSYSRHEEGHGWVGIRFQSTPRGPSSDIILHVRMFDDENMHEQEALGVLGVNLIYCAMYLSNDPLTILRTLMEDLSNRRMEVDMVRFSGHAYEGVDNRIMSLMLVRYGLSTSAMFTASGDVVQAGEILYKRPILVLRGSFRPITNTITDMLAHSVEQFKTELAADAAAGTSMREPIVLTEMTLNNLIEGDKVDINDFLARAVLLESLGANVLITNLAHFHAVAAYLSRYTDQKIAIVLGIPALLQLLDDKYYTDLDGGILEAFGRLFKARVQLMVYPYRDPKTSELTEVDNLSVAAKNRDLYQYLLHNNLIVSVKKFREDQLNIFPTDVRERILRGDPSWESEVPPSVAEIIKKEGYFGYRTLS